MSNLSSTQQLVEVADGVVAAINGDGSFGLANSVTVIDGGAALVVDAMLLPRMADRLCFRQPHVHLLTRSGCRSASSISASIGCAASRPRCRS